MKPNARVTHSNKATDKRARAIGIPTDRIFPRARSTPNKTARRMETKRNADRDGGEIRMRDKTTVAPRLSHCVMERGAQNETARKPLFSANKQVHSFSLSLPAGQQRPAHLARSQSSSSRARRRFPHHAATMSAIQTLHLSTTLGLGAALDTLCLLLWLCKQKGDDAQMARQAGSNRQLTTALWGSAMQQLAGMGFFQHLVRLTSACSADKRSHRQQQQ
jgi:hypothetical protein